MPSSPARLPRPPPKPSAPRRTQSYSPNKTPMIPPTVRRHTTHAQRPSGSSPRRSPAPSPSPRRSRTTSPSSRGNGPHVLIPVPIRARDAESPVYVRAPSGQRVDFVFSAPKKRGFIGRLLDRVEWGEPQENKPFRYRKPSPKSSGSKPFYKKFLL